MKRIVFICLLFAIFATHNTYAYDFEVDGIYYNILPQKVNEVEVTRKGFGYTYEGEIKIPKEVIYNGIVYKVTAIGVSAFNNCGNLTGSIVLPEGITSIGDGAFADCTKMEGPLVLPRTIKYIGKMAFSWCKGLTGRLMLPDSLETIGEEAFHFCQNLSGSLVFPKSIKEIGPRAFEACGFNGELILPEGINNISEGCFSNTKFTGHLFIPDSVERIYNEAFKSCKFTSVRFPKSLISIYKDAYKDCIHLTSIYCESNYTCSFSSNPFQNIAYSAVLYVPKGMKSIYETKSAWTSYFSTIEEVDNVTNILPLVMSSYGKGSISFGDLNISNSVDGCFVDYATSCSFAITPNNGYRIKKAQLNEADIKDQVANNLYTIKKINKRVYLEVEFIDKTAATYTLSINAKGNGVVSYNKNSIKDETKTFTLDEGETVNISYTTDANNYLKSLFVNSVNEIDKVENNTYKIGNISTDIIIEISFSEKIKSFEKNGVNYSVSSFEDKTVIVDKGNYEYYLDIPATTTYQDYVWTVIGIYKDVLNDNKSISSIIWNPNTKFELSVNNPNFLLYVKSEDYAPASIYNIIIEGNAEKITLTDAVNGNDFFCPKDFTAKSISYTHNYNMTTGIGEPKGWETIVLPFEVQHISHPSKGEILPYLNWKNEKNKKPFWLMEYGSEGWKNANSIKANTPYIISMPNHTNYKTEFRVNGNITFSSENVVVKATDNLTKVTNGNQSFVPNYTNQDDESFYVLNVNNDFVSYNGEYVEGSRFIKGLRSVRPFEAYMTSSSNSTRSIPISDDMTTGIDNLTTTDIEIEVCRIYNLQGQLIKADKSGKETMRDLPAGVYIVNGKKLIIK